MEFSKNICILNEIKFRSEMVYPNHAREIRLWPANFIISLRADSKDSHTQLLIKNNMKLLLFISFQFVRQRVPFPCVPTTHRVFNFVCRVLGRRPDHIDSLLYIICTTPHTYFNEIPIKLKLFCVQQSFCAVRQTCHFPYTAPAEKG